MTYKFKVGDKIVPTETVNLSLGYFARGFIYEIEWVSEEIYETTSGHCFFLEDAVYFVPESVYYSKLNKALR